MSEDDRYEAMEQAELYDMAMDELRDQIPRWIPVGERLPEDGVAVLVTNGADVCCALRNSKFRPTHLENEWNPTGVQADGFDMAGIELGFDAVTHWQPLPLPPEGA